MPFKGTCKIPGARKYIFGEQGKNYAELSKFKEASVEIFFQNYKHPKYYQQNSNFKYNMSIIDLIFNHGKKSLEIITNGQENFGLK